MNPKSEADAASAFEDVAGRSPREFPWGYYSYSDLPGPFCGSGTGGFCWFHSQDEAVAFFLDVDLAGHWLSPARGDRAAEQLQQVREIVASREAWKPFEGSISQVNEALRGLVQLQWWGTFDELRSEDGEFARSVREFYWSMQDQEGHRGIPESDADEFSESLWEYGI
jgi:hypothetical protein